MSQLDIFAPAAKPFLDIAPGMRFKVPGGDGFPEQVAEIHELGVNTLCGCQSCKDGSDRCWFVSIGGLAGQFSETELAGMERVG